MKKLKGFFGHLKTIIKHRHLVIQHARKAGILWQGLFHDLSKFSLTEFIPGCKYYQGTRSPNEREREVYGYSKAWMHHKGRNKHHFEYWTDYSEKVKNYVPVPMPIKYFKEMVCDRMAASKTYKKDLYTDASPLEYLIAKKGMEKMHEDTGKLLFKVFTILKEQGEKAMFAYLRKIKSYEDEK